MSAVTFCWAYRAEERFDDGSFKKKEYLSKCGRYLRSACVNRASRPLLRVCFLSCQLLNHPIWTSRSVRFMHGICWHPQYQGSFSEAVCQKLRCPWPSVIDPMTSSQTHVELICAIITVFFFFLREYRYKDNVSMVQNGTRVSAYNTKSFVFLPEKSVGDPFVDVITTVNIPSWVSQQLQSCPRHSEKKRASKWAKGEFWRLSPSCPSAGPPTFF